MSCRVLNLEKSRFRFKSSSDGNFELGITKKNDASWKILLLVFNYSLHNSHALIKVVTTYKGGNK